MQKEAVQEGKKNEPDFDGVPLLEKQIKGIFEDLDGLPLQSDMAGKDVDGVPLDIDGQPGMFILIINLNN